MVKAHSVLQYHPQIYSGRNGLQSSLMYARDRGFKAVRVKSSDIGILFILLHYANHLHGISVLFQTGKGTKRRCINVSGFSDCQNHLHPLPDLH